MREAAEHAGLNRRKWDRRAETFDRKRYDFFRAFQRRVVSLAGLEAGQRFLDLGCGTGWAVRHAAGLLGESGMAFGVDISSRMIEKAIQGSSGIANVSFQVGSSDRLPFSDGFFDVIICTNSFHHYLDPLRALIEARRVLMPGGRILILDLCTDDAFMKWIDERTRKKEPEHVKYYGTAELHAFFEGAGLVPLSSRLIVYPMKVHAAHRPY